MNEIKYRKYICLRLRLNSMLNEPDIYTTEEIKVMLNRVKTIRDKLINDRRVILR